MRDDCLFCSIYESKEGIIYENATFYARFDKNPVNRGHALVIPIEHLVSFVDLQESEMPDLLKAIQETEKIINEKHHPDAYNIGVNDGVEAGRTIHHLHIHLIPRYRGDVENPRGGVRHIIPGKGDYTKLEKPL